jgi:hypothetical protein
MTNKKKENIANALNNSRNLGLDVKKFKSAQFLGGSVQPVGVFLANS